MGSNNSSQSRETECKVAELRRERERLEAERCRLEQVTREQQQLEYRLREEQRYKDAAEKWRQEQRRKQEIEEIQRKHAYESLQRELEKLKTQQQSQTQRPILQTSIPLFTPKQESMVMAQAVPVQREVLPISTANTKPCNAPKISNVSLPKSTQEAVKEKKQVLVQRKIVPAVADKQNSNNKPQPAHLLQPINAPQPTRAQISFDTTRVVLEQQRVSNQARPRTNDTSLIALANGPADNICSEWTILDYVLENHLINKAVAAKLIKLFDDDNTVPFIAKYRKGLTQGMDVVELRQIKNSYDYAKLVKQQAASMITETIAKQARSGEWIEQFRAHVQEVKTLSDLDYINSVYNGKHTTLVEKAIAVGLGIVARVIMIGLYVDSLSSLVEPSTEGRETELQVKDGIIHVIADTLMKDKRVFDIVQKLISTYDPQIETKVKYGCKHKQNMQKYGAYHNITSFQKDLEVCQISMISRGIADKALVVKILIPNDFGIAFKANCLQLYPEAVNSSPLNRRLITAAIEYMYIKTIKPFIRKWANENRNQIAEKAAMKIIAQDVELLILASNTNDNGNEAVSMARGFDDPIEKLINIHLPDRPKTYTAMILNGIITDTVSFIGVDVNTVPVYLLKRLAGLDDEKAKLIIRWRNSFGALTTRNNLQITGSKAFEQCAGFIRIIPETAVGPDGLKIPKSSLTYLDQTTIHPESYGIAKAFLKAAKCNVNQLGTKAFTFAVKLFADQDKAALARKFGTRQDVIDVIVEGLTKEKTEIVKAVEINDNVAVKPRRKITFDDLEIGTALIGIVRNVTNFGAFVEVGVERQGLIINRFMRGMTVVNGQRVETEVNTIEKDRRRFGLTLLRCL